MSIKPGDRNWGSNNKTFNYLGKDFATIRQNIIDFTKTYYPNLIQNFIFPSQILLMVVLV